VSGSLDDFGLYSPEQQNVPKVKLPARALCADWSPDGQFLALGLFNGLVLIRDKQGEALVLDRFRV
jgi:intraflagellar transport protein 122